MMSDFWNPYKTSITLSSETSLSRTGSAQAIQGLPQLWLPSSMGQTSSKSIKPGSATSNSQTTLLAVDSNNMRNTSVPTSSYPSIPLHTLNDPSLGSKAFSKEVVVSKVDLSGQSWDAFDLQPPLGSQTLPEIKEASESNLSNRSYVDRMYQNNTTVYSHFSARSQESSPNPHSHRERATVITNDMLAGSIPSTPTINKELDQLKKSLGQQKMIKNLQETVRDLQKQRDQEKRQAEAVRRQLQLKLSTTSNQLKQFKQSLKQSAQINATLNGNSSLQISRLQSEVNNRLKNQIELKNEVDLLSNKLAQLQRNIQLQQTQASLTQSTIGDAAKQIEQLKRQNGLLTQKIAEYEQKRLQHIRIITTLQTEIQQLASSHAKSIQAVHEERDASKAETQKLKAQCVRLSSIGNSLGSQKQENDRLKRQISNIQSHLHAYEAKVEKYQLGYQQDRQHAFDTIKKLEQLKEAEVTAKKGLEQQNSRLHSLYVNLQYQKQSLSEQLGRVTSEAEQLKLANHKLSAEIQQLSQQMTIKQQEAARTTQLRLESQQKHTAELLEKYKLKQSQLTNQVKSLQQKLETAKSQYEVKVEEAKHSQDAELNNLLAQLDSQSSVVRRLKQQNESLRIDLQQAQQEVTAKHTQLLARDKEYESVIADRANNYTQQNNLLAQTLRQKQAELTTLSISYSDLQARFEAAQRKRQDHDREVRRIQKQFDQLTEKLQSTKLQLRKYTQLEAELQFSKNLLQQSRDQIVNYKNQNRLLKGSLEQSLHHNDQQVISLQDQLRIRNAEVKNLNQKLAQLNAAEAEIKRSHQEKLQKLNMDWKQREDTANRELQSLRHEITALRDSNKALSDQNIKLGQQIINLEAGMEDQRHSIREGVNKYQMEIKQLSARLHQEKQARGLLESRLKDTGLQWSRTQLPHSSRNESKVLQETVESQNNTIQFLQNRLNQKQECLKKNIEFITNLENRLNALQSNSKAEDFTQLQVKEQAFSSKQDQIVEIINQHFSKLSKYPPQFLTQDRKQPSLTVSFGSKPSAQGYHAQRRLLLLNQLIQIIQTMSQELKDAQRFTKQVLQKKLVEGENQIDKIGLELKSVTYERDHLLNQVGGLITKLKYVQENLEYATQTNRNLEQEILKLRRINTTLKSQLDRETDNRQWLETRVLTKKDTTLPITRTGNLQPFSKSPGKINGVTTTLQKAKVQRQQILSKIKDVVTVHSPKTFQPANRPVSSLGLARHLQR